MTFEVKVIKIKYGGLEYRWNYMHVGRKYDGWEIKSHVKVFVTDRLTDFFKKFILYEKVF
jgi:hypothetical protein